MELFGFEVSVSIILVIAAVVLLYMYSTWTYSTFKKMGIPGPTPWPHVGNQFQLYSLGMHNRDVLWFKKYGKVFGTYGGRQAVLVVADPEICKQICVKNYTSFYNRRKSQLKNKPLDSGLMMLNDEHWKNKRNTLTPAFTGSKMRMMSPLLNKAADPLVRVLRKHCEEGTPIECKNVFGGYVSDSLASAGFGIDINSQEHPDHPFVKNAKQVFRFTFLNPILLILIFLPMFVPILNWLDIGIMPQRIKKYFLDLIEETIHLRKTQDQSKKRVDIMQLMLDAHEVYEQWITENEGEEDENGVRLVKDGKSSTGDFHKGFTNKEILGQSLLFYVAGFETTSTLICFVAYSMATNPDIQEKLCAEIDDVMANYDEPNYEVVSKMPYLDMIVCETLRMYPPAIRFDRSCNEDVTVAGIHIPKGMIIHVANYPIHHNPEIYPEPEKFIPERFTKEEKAKRHPYAWLPFGAGPRNCIGMRFALLETKIGLVRTFKNFTFEPCAETQIPVELGKFGFLSPPNGIKLKVVSRKQ